MNKPTVIVTNAFNMGLRGGIIATHKLALLLQEKGIDAFVWGANGDTLPNVKEAPDSLIDSGDFNAIYPEGWDKNRLNAKRKTHLWLLHHPKHKYEGFDKAWYFEKGYTDDTQDYLNGIKDSTVEQLKIIDISLVLYCNDNAPRKGRCYVYHKNQLAAHMGYAPLDWKNLDGAIPYNDDLPAIFNSYESFYSYDPWSFYNLLAAACGCRSIVHPIPDMSKEEYIKLRPFAEFLCYGEDDIIEDQETKCRAALLEQAKPHE